MSTEETPDRGRAEELLRHAPDIVVEVGLDGRLIYVSDAVEPILGRSAASLRGLSFLEIVVPEDRDSTLSLFQKVIETGIEPSLRFRVERPDGLRVELEAVVRVFSDLHSPMRIVAVCRDVTQQSSHQAVDQERNSQYRNLVEAGAHAAAIVTSSGGVLFSNRRFKALFGSRSSLQEIGQHASEEARSALSTAWHTSTRREESVPGAIDLDYRHEDGSTSWFAVAWDAFLTEAGERRFSVSLVDITRRKTIEIALRSLAGDVAADPRTSALHTLATAANALELDRIVIGRLDPANPDSLQVVAAWQDGEPIEPDVLRLDGLPDQTVARGELCIHPTRIGQLMPGVTERFGPGFESYAGIPLRRADGRVVGLIGGYGRKSCREPELVRALLPALAVHALAAIDRRSTDTEGDVSEARFDILARHACDLVIEVDHDERITYISDSCLEILGVRPEAAIGLPMLRQIHPEDLEVARRSRDLARAGEENFVAVARVRDTQGRWRWFESRVCRFEAPDGSVRSLILATDTTERRREELGRDLLLKVVQHGTDLVFVCEPDTTVLYANEAATRLFDAPVSDESPERTLYEVLSADDARRLRDEILPGISHSTPWSGNLELIRSHDQSEIATEARIFLFESGGAMSRSHLAVTLRDITKRRSAEEALRESELRLSQAQKMEAVGRLAGGIAHDFNNLLTAIIGYSDLVLDELGVDHVNRRDVEEIMRAAERAGGLTRQLLAFSRRQVLQPRSVELNAVVADIDRMMRRLIGENIELVTLQTGELERIIADPGQIEQVIVNLVVNARDAMPQGGRLEIETANFSTREAMVVTTGVLEAGDYVLLRVSDTGSGMTAEVRSRIFEPFFTTKEAHRGTGLGLASVYGIISQSGGQIDVDTAPGHGATFAIYLPTARLRPDEARPPSEPGQLKGNETILLVEDSDPVRGLVRRTLEKAGYHVLAADSATEALRLCSRHQGSIDLLLSDVVLPKMAGPEIARRAMELRPEIRVLFMSGFTDDTLTQHGLEPQNAVILEKPFTPSMLMSRIRGVLDDGPAPSERASDDDPFPVEHSD